MKNKLIKSAVATLITIATTHTASAATTNMSAMPDNEKCYGIVKKGLNDCATSTQSCAGSATKDNEPDAFLFMPKGLCEKIVGGVVKPDNTKKG